MYTLQVTQNTLLCTMYTESRPLHIVNLKVYIAQSILLTEHPKLHTAPFKKQVVYCTLSTVHRSSYPV